jgi:integrase
MKQVPESRSPQPRGENAVCDIMKKFRAFFRWANGLSKSARLTDNNPFDNYTMPEEKYGTPYYITIDERKQLYNAQLDEPLATQRDIFVFQCLIGCRVSDLWSMTKDSIINGKVQYIARKTKDDNPETVTVPLTATANEILEKYKDFNGKGLFPFTSQQQYNIDIKAMFKQAGLNRIVTVLNPTTRDEEKRPLYEVASSHMARRTFVGNLYKQVKDPNLICPMSGHKVGSKAFARYTAIDEDLMKETVNLLE